MDIIHETRVQIQSLDSQWFCDSVEAVDMLRLDLLHPVISGNKWYKLKENIRFAIENGYETVLTFGGAYSNHLIATAAAAKMYGLNAIGIVRGTYAATSLTPTLQSCRDYGMELAFLSREDYERKTNVGFLADISKKFEHPFIIPEGGANEQGRAGAASIASLISSGYSHICVSVGTGTTLIGLRNALPEIQAVLGFAPMKGGAYLEGEVQQYLNRDKNWRLFDDWHFGGFGKHPQELLDFMNDFYQQHSIPLDVVYTGKMMAGLQALMKADFFSPNARILCIHTGGLQGNESVADKLIYSV
jgi:1-aminocyclopropane-1-carboxylate deaminase